MRDFVDAERSRDVDTCHVLMQFAFHSCHGNMDEAFAAIRTLKSEKVWRNMARMCVKSRRLDVARVCLANMGLATGVRMLDSVEAEPQLEARVAMLALILDMKDEAMALYKSCERWDLLNRVLQDTGRWDEAVSLATHKDRLHLRHTHYRYARAMEARGDIDRAVVLYEKSGTHAFQVPRMLFDDATSLQQYALQSNDSEVGRWWAQYMESTGDLQLAVQHYSRVNDYLSVARVYCYLNQLTKAASLADKTSDRAACYHLARQYENMDDFKNAIHFFTRAQAYGNAIRLCKESRQEEQMMNLALLAPPSQQILAARYFESLGRVGAERSVLLYNKAGLLTKSTELAFKHQQFDILQQIAVQLSADSDPRLLHRCAQFFLQHEMHDKAVDMLAVSKQYVEALDLCVEHNIPITDEVADRLVIPKGEGSEQERRSSLLKVAQCAHAQGNYHLATRKFTEAGDQVNAMKSLTKSADIDRVIYFAQTSRHKEVYIMAANYLQSADWLNRPEIAKAIVTFYKKAKTVDLLSSFYETKAQTEVDECGNFEAALSSLQSAHLCVTGDVTSAAGRGQLSRDLSSDLQRRASALTLKIDLLKRFIHLRRLAGNYSSSTDLSADNDPVLTQLTDLLADLTSDDPVPRGLLFSLIVQRLVAADNMQLAHRTLQQMTHVLPGVNVSDFIDSAVLSRIHMWLESGNSRVNDLDLGSMTLTRGQ